MTDIEMDETQNGESISEQQNEANERTEFSIELDSLSERVQTSLSLIVFTKEFRDLALRIDVREFPKVVWHGTTFPKGTLQWMYERKFVLGRSYSDIISMYEGATDAAVHWRAVLDIGQDLINISYIAYEYPGFLVDPTAAVAYRGPSRSAHEFDARTKIWALKREVWETTISFYSRPRSRDLDTFAPALAAEQAIDAALIAAEESGVFKPWQETTTSAPHGHGHGQTVDGIDHTHHLLNPFDPILPGNLTISDAMMTDDF